MPVYRSIVTIVSPSLGGTGTNTWHARSAGGGGAEADLQLCTDALESFYNGIGALFATTTTLATDGVWTRVDDESGEVHDVDGWSVTNATSSPPLPPQLALVAGWRASAGGRSGRGRTFVGPLAVETLQANGSPTEAARLTLQNEMDGVIAFNGDNDGVALGVWSPKDNVIRDFTGGSVRNLFASLRSRRD